MNFQELGDRMKEYETLETGRRLMPRLPVYARIDGRCFSAFTRAMRRPFDEDFSNLMIETTRYLVQEMDALVGYTQSDEISLAWYYDHSKAQMTFDRRIQKLVSSLAASATMYFNRNMRNHLPGQHWHKMPTFDARVFNFPNLEEMANCFLWRERDATKNSVSMLAQAHFSHKQLDRKNTSDKLDMLMSKGINWNEEPPAFKRGTYLVRRKVTRKLTPEELSNLPPKHDAHKNPDMLVGRTILKAMWPPPLGRVTNRVDFLFNGAEPLEAQLEEAESESVTTT